MTAKILKNYKYAAVLAVVFCGHLIAQTATSEPFTEYKITLPFPASQPALPANITDHPGEELIAVGKDENNARWLTLYTFDSVEQHFTLLDKALLPENFIAFDVGEKSELGAQSLYFLTKSEVLKYHFEAQGTHHRWSKIANVSSIYMAETTDTISHKDFVKDINNDQRDDIILPYFDSLNLWFQNDKNKWVPFSVPITPRVQFNDQSTTFFNSKIFFSDMTLDGKDDIVVPHKGRLDVYPQDRDGHFSTQILPFPVAASIDELEWWEVTAADGEGLDQSNLSHRVIEDVRDVNSDGLPDLVVAFTQSSGVFKRSNDYEFYFGQNIDERLFFIDSPSTVIRSKDTLTDLKLVDLNNDKHLEALVSGFDISLSKIIGALLSGGIKQEFMVFSMDQQNQFGDEPASKVKVKLRFSLSTGQSGFPLAKVADINGDKLKDLVFSSGSDSMKIAIATSDAAAPFEKNRLRYKTQIPQDAQEVLGHDINGDGKSDLVMHYGRLDDAGLANTLMILLAK